MQLIIEPTDKVVTLEYTEFEEALQQTRKPSAEVQAIPLRLIL